MKIRSVRHLGAAMLLSVVAGCGGQAVEDVPDTGAGSARQTSDELAGTSWRLVEIASMDDSEWVPGDPSMYTLTFGTDGSVSIVADCNRGTGSYTSQSPGQLRFGVIAATQALCPPPSLHDVYMKQFEWVRSYVFEGGALFLATMADGSIIEFQPAATGSGQP